jgi:hypothetical protein
MKEDSSRGLYTGVEVNFWMTQRHCDKLEHFFNATFDTTKVCETGGWGSVVFGDCSAAGYFWTFAAAVLCPRGAYFALAIYCGCRRRLWIWHRKGVCDRFVNRGCWRGAVEVDFASSVG